jgi:hypothetical protein
LPQFLPDCHACFALLWLPAGMRDLVNPKRARAKSSRRISCELPAAMSAAAWHISFPTGSWVATHRGVRIVIKRSVSRQSGRNRLVIGGREAESLPVDCDEELAKKIGIDVVDQRISVHELWPQGGKEG